MKLIDGDDFVRYFKENLDIWNHAEALDWAIGKLERTPAVDAVPVIRCENCTHSKHNGWWCVGLSTMPPHETLPDKFCSYGERMEYEP